MMTQTDKKGFMLNTFKTQFTSMPEELKDLKAKNCLSFAIQIHKNFLSSMTEAELKKLEDELK